MKLQVMRVLGLAVTLASTTGGALVWAMSAQVSTATQMAADHGEPSPGGEIDETRDVADELGEYGLPSHVELRRRAVEAEPVQGLPDLPPEVLARVRRESLRVKVLEAELLDKRPLSAASDDYCDRRCRLTLDHGAADGLLAGFEVRCEGGCGDSSVYAHARIIGGTEQAIAELNSYEKCNQRSAPRRGWVMETGAYVPGG